MMDSVNAALMGKIQDDGWEEEARSFGKNFKTVCDMMDALDCGVDVEDYPRVMYESTRILESSEGDQPREGTDKDDRQQHHSIREDQRTRGNDRHTERNRSRSRRPRHEGRDNEEMERDGEKW